MLSAKHGGLVDSEQFLDDRDAALAAAITGIASTREGYLRMNVSDKDAAIYANAAFAALRIAGLEIVKRRRPKRSRGEKPPADAIGRAVMVAKIATGEVEDER